MREKELRRQTREAEKKFDVLQELAKNGDEAAMLLLGRLQQALQAERLQEKVEFKAQNKGTAAADEWLGAQVQQGRDEVEGMKAAQAKMASEKGHFISEEATKQMARDEMEA